MRVTFRRARALWITSVLLMAGAALPGPGPGVAQAQAGATFLQGSWGTDIRVTDTDPANEAKSCSEATAWMQVDGAATVDAFQATNQSLFIHALDNAAGTGCTWHRLRQLASAIEAAPELGDFTLAASLPSTLTLAGFLEGIARLRGEAANHSSLKAVVLNDFDVPLQFTLGGSDRTLGPAEVQQLWDEAHEASANPSLELWAYMASGSTGAVIMPAFTLGVKYGPASSALRNYWLYPDGYGGCEGDEISAEFDYTTPADAAGAFTLSFLVYDYYWDEPTKSNLSLVVDVNGQRLAAKESLHGNKTYAYHVRLYESEDFAAHLKPAGGTNAIRISLELTGDALTSYSTRGANVWDLLVRQERSGAITETTYDATALEGFQYAENRDVTCLQAKVASEITATASADAIFAGTNQAYRITDAIDAFLPQVGGFAWYGDEPREREGFRRVVESACKLLRGLGKTCIPTFHGLEADFSYTDTTYHIDLAQEAYKLRDAQAYADGVVVWSLVNDLAEPNGGIFTNREALHDGYDLLGYWPWLTGGLPGFYQRWETTAATSGTYELRWADSVAATTDADGDGVVCDDEAVCRFVKQLEVLPSGSSVPDFEWDAGLEADGKSGNLTFQAHAGDTLRVTFAEELGTAYPNWYAEFRVLDPAGSPFGRDAWTYASGIEDKVVLTYRCFTEFFKTGTAGPSHCPKDYDDAPPDVSLAASCARPGNPGWCVAPSYTYEGTAIDAGTGLAAGQPACTLDGKAAACNGTVASEGPHVVEASAEDLAGQRGAASLRLGIDSRAPSTTVAFEGLAGKNGWFVGPVTARLRCSDPAPGSDCARDEHALDGAPFAEGSNVTEAGDGAHALRFRSHDAAGNTGAEGSAAFRIDSTPPELRHRLDGAQGSAGWWRSPVQVGLDCHDATSGVPDGGVSYRLDGGAPQPYVQPFQVAGDGEHEVQPHCEDTAGNVALRVLRLRIDTLPPAVELTSPAAGSAQVNQVRVPLPVPLPVTLVVGPTQARAAASDATSGVERVEFWVDGSLRFVDREAPYGFLWPADREPLGSHRLAACAFDVAGNSARAVEPVVTAPTNPQGVLATVQGLTVQGRAPMECGGPPRSVP